MYIIKSVIVNNDDIRKFVKELKRKVKSKIDGVLYLDDDSKLFARDIAIYFEVPLFSIGKVVVNEPKVLLVEIIGRGFIKKKIELCKGFNIVKTVNLVVYKGAEKADIYMTVYDGEYKLMGYGIDDKYYRIKSIFEVKVVDYE